MFSVDPKLHKYFKGFCSSPEIIMMFVYMKCRFSLSYRDLEEMIIMRGLSVDHATLQRWVRRFAHLIENRIRRKKKPVNGSWRMDETYIKVKGQWKYLYRAVDKEGNTIDFLLRYRRNKVAAKAFFKKAFKESGRPDLVNIDKSGSNKSALVYINNNLTEDQQIKIRQNKYLNNIVEQDHRFIKKRTRPMLGFKNFYSAKSKLAGIESVMMIQKGQLIGTEKNRNSWNAFVQLMA